MTEALLIALVGFINISCFIVGAKVGQKVSKGETIETPTLNPLQAIREHNDKKEAQREQDRYEAILRNVEAYDGTGNGQREVPKG